MFVCGFSRDSTPAGVAVRGHLSGTVLFIHLMTNGCTHPTISPAQHYCFSQDLWGCFMASDFCLQTLLEDSEKNIINFEIMFKGVAKNNVSLLELFPFVLISYFIKGLCFINVYNTFPSFSSTSSPLTPSLSQWKNLGILVGEWVILSDMDDIVKCLSFCSRLCCESCHSWGWWLPALWCLLRLGLPIPRRLSECSQPFFHLNLQI